jgi:SpoIID/LytB domain protein
MEALKAQVVAARSYALVHYARPTEEGAALGYNLCATPACQVYAGMAVSDGPYGDRWRAAVQATTNLALLFQGKPAETVYFSTSNGRTYGNDKVFGSSPVPYLRAVRDRNDAASPLSHWKAHIPLGDLTRFLRAGGHWAHHRIQAVRKAGGTMVLKGSGATKKMSVDDFRSSVNFWAPCLEPNAYPEVNRDGRLPQTIPSHWFRARTSAGGLALVGRGWGHGVGMAQWGAYGKAKRGLTYRQILADYYGGLRPEVYPEPSTIRIGIAVGLKAIRVSPTGSVRLSSRRGVPGPWLVTGGKHLRVHHGAGPSPSISPGRLLRTPRRVRVGRPFEARLLVPQLSVVSLLLEGNGASTKLDAGVTREAGMTRVRATVPAGAPAGTYSIRSVVSDGVDIVTSNTRRIHVTAARGSPSLSALPTPSPRPPTARAAPPSSSQGGLAARLVIAVLAAAALIAVGFAAWRWRGLPR